MTPPLYNIVDKAYHGVIDLMPEALQERSMASAFVLGAAGTHGVLRGLQYISRKHMDKIIPGFDEKAMPVIERGCISGMAALPLLYAIVDPEGAKEIMTLHPTYTSGMAGVWASSIATAANDLHKRSLEEKVE